MAWVRWLLGLILGGLTNLVSGNRKSQLDVERDVGERTGQLETENASLKNYIEAEQKADSASDSVSNDADSVYNDPANRNNPSSPYHR